MRTILFMLALAAPCSGQIPKDKPKLTDVAVKNEEIAFKKTPQGELKLHAYYPADWKAEDKRPAIVFFFGGGWKNGSHTQFKPQAEYLAARGMPAFCAEYRIESQHKTTPDCCVEDAKSAVRYIRGNAAKLGVDPAKIVGAGGSAGGHLAAATYFLEGFNDPMDDAKVDCKPNALVLFNPALEVASMRVKDKDGKDISKQFWPTASLRKTDIPIIQFFGTSDNLLAPAKDFAEKAAKMDVKVETWLADGQPHGFFNRPPYTQTTLEKTEAFLLKHGYLKGEPTLKVPTGAPKLTQ